MRQPNVIIRMGANRHTIMVRSPRIGDPDHFVTFDMNAMDRKERSAFHREFMNAFRQSQATT
jgi:hypothetical protein